MSRESSRSVRVRGDVLSSARKNKGWSQSELIAQTQKHDQTSVSLGALEKAERGGPSFPSTLKALAQVLDIELKSLIVDETRPQPSEAVVPDSDPRVVDPIALLSAWEKSKEWMRRQLAKEMTHESGALDHAYMAQVLLHSIQPAYYLDDLPSLSRLADWVGKSVDSRDPSPELLDACRIVLCACAFYEIMDRIGKALDPGRSCRGDHIRLLDRLESPLDSKSDSELFDWLDAIRLNFLGRSRYELRQNQPNKSKCLDVLKKAGQDFEDSLGRLEKVNAVGLVRHYVDLWGGYVWRNLGANYEAISENAEGEGDKDQARVMARKCYSKAMERRKNAYSHLHNIDEAIREQIRVEIKLVELDMMRLENDVDADHGAKLIPIWNDLKEHRPTLSGVWEHALIQVRKTAELLDEHVVAEDVEAVLDRAPILSASVFGSGISWRPVSKRIVLSLLTWNTRDVSRESARALVEEAQLLRRMSQVPHLCIVDNGSDDGTAEALRELEAELGSRADFPHKFLYNPTNLGNSLARNQIINYMLECGADYLLMMDGDIEIVPFSSFAMFLHMEKSNRQLGCIGADCRRHTPDRAKVSPYLDAIDRAALRKGEDIAWTQYGMFRREVFEHRIRFEESEPFRGGGWGFEDVDLAFQMLEKRYELQHCNSLVYLHRHIRSSVKSLVGRGLDAARLFEARKEWVLRKWDGKMRRDILDRVRRTEFAEPEMNS